jgi:multidrug efflux system membrane fusion protein
MNKLFFLFLALALGVSGCSRPPAAQEPVRAVKVLRVGTEAFASGLEFSGEVRARVESRLGFRLGGKLTQRLVEPGQRVQAGQLLAQLDPSDAKLAVDAARAQVEAARTQRDLAAADVKRYQALKEQNFISGAELERRETTLKAAQAQLEQAQAQLSVQANQAGYASLKADVSGVVTAVEAEVGQVLAMGAPVLRIAADGPRDVVFAVPEDKVSRLRTGQAVTLQPWAQTGQGSGRVREVAASADPLTRTFQVKVALAGAQPLPLGSTVSVRVPGLGGAGLEGQSVIKLPTTALRQDGPGTAVWLVDEASMTVKSQPVQVATADGNEAVIASGLSPGMVVVSTGVHVLSPGQKVTLFASGSAMPAAPAAAR